MMPCVLPGCAEAWAVILESLAVHGAGKAFPKSVLTEVHHPPMRDPPKHL